MTSKIFIMTTDAQGDSQTQCRVLCTENGAQLEKRIDSILSNLKADGYKEARLMDCFSLDFPQIYQRD